MTSLIGWLVSALIVATTVAGQQPSTRERPTFEIVSVKTNMSGDTAMRLDVQPNGRLVVINVPLKQFIRAAYTLQLSQIADAPSWVDSERFDITAISEGDLAAPAVWTPGQFAPVQLMMQSILADRFAMRSHTEAREAQGYALVQRGSGSTAGKLTATSAPCPPDCGIQVGAGTVTARNVPLPQFAELLSQLTGRVVVDETGLSGRFNFEARWAPDSPQGQNDSDAPSLFTALQEQLGLRLEPRRAPVPMPGDRFDRAAHGRLMALRPSNPLN